MQEWTSAYAAFRPRKSLEAQIAFRRQLAESLQPLLAEVISPETRKLQQQLLVTAGLLLLLSLSVITVSGEAAWQGIKLTVVANSAIAIALLITLYLEVVVSLRSTLEWRAWRLQTATAELSLEEAIRFALMNSPSGADSYIEESSRHADEVFSRNSDDSPKSEEEITRLEAEKKSSRDEQKLIKEQKNENAVWISSTVKPLRRISTTRANFEALFPVLFGAAAILIVVILKLLALR